MQKSALCDMMRQNDGDCLLFLLDDTDIPFTLWVLLNLKKKWDLTWKYHPDNEQGSTEEEKAKFKKYNDMNSNDVKKLKQSELDEYELYKEKNGRFVQGVTRHAFGEAITETGRIFMKRMVRDWRKLINHEDHRVYLDEQWSILEEEHKLGEAIWRGRKRKTDDSNLTSKEKSDVPKSVFMVPGDEGYEEWKKKQDECLSDDDGDDDEVDGEIDYVYIIIILWVCDICVLKRISSK